MTQLLRRRFTRPHDPIHATSPLTPNDVNHPKELHERAPDSPQQRRHLETRDRSARVALQLLAANIARRGRRIVAAARRTLDELEHPIGLDSAASCRTPVRAAAPKRCVGEADLADADEN